MKSKKMLFFISVLVVLTMILTACGGSAPAATEPAQTEKPTSAPAATEAPPLLLTPNPLRSLFGNKKATTWMFSLTG